jgi:hypothetical protein
MRQLVLDARVRHHWRAVSAGPEQLYPDDAEQLDKELRERVAQHVAMRPDDLFLRDLEREAEPDWFQQPTMVGYVAYADRFAGTLPGVVDPALCADNRWMHRPGVEVRSARVTMASMGYVWLTTTD